MRLSLFTGKGGVGKSTVVAAAAFEAARLGGRPLIVELGHRASMGAIFSVDDIGHDPVEVEPGVFATNIDVDAALADYVRAHVPLRSLAKRITRSRSLMRFFEAAPAVGEILTLHHLRLLMEGEYDPILVDFDATGHALMFLELPGVFEGLVPEGPVRQLLDGFTAMLTDRRTRLHLVTLPKKLPIKETVQLYRRLREEHPGITLGTLFINRVPVRPLSTLHDEALGRLMSELGPEHPAGPDLWLLREELESYERARAAIKGLEVTGLARVELPSLGAWVSRAQLRALGRAVGSP